MVGGDAGGGGANLDYQLLGLFAYSFTPKFGLGPAGAIWMWTIVATISLSTMSR
jgi:hypothetical protein